METPLASILRGLIAESHGDPASAASLYRSAGTEGTPGHVATRRLAALTGDTAGLKHLHAEQRDGGPPVASAAACDDLAQALTPVEAGALYAGAPAPADPGAAAYRLRGLRAAGLDDDFDALLTDLVPRCTPVVGVHVLATLCDAMATRVTPARLDALLVLAGEDNVPPATLALAAKHLSRARRWPQAESAWRTVGDQREQLFGVAHPSTLLARVHIARAVGAQPHRRDDAHRELAPLLALTDGITPEPGNLRWKVLSVHERIARRRDPLASEFRSLRRAVAP